MLLVYFVHGYFCGACLDLQNQNNFGPNCKQKVSQTMLGSNVGGKTDEKKCNACEKINKENHGNTRKF